MLLQAQNKANLPKSCHANLSLLSLFVNSKKQNKRIIVTQKERTKLCPNTRKPFCCCSHQMRLAPNPMRRHAKRTEPTLRTRYCLGQFVFSSAFTRKGYLSRSCPNLSSIFVSLSMTSCFCSDEAACSLARRANKEQKRVL